MASVAMTTPHPAWVTRASRQRVQVRGKRSSLWAMLALAAGATAGMGTPYRAWDACQSSRARHRSLKYVGAYGNPPMPPRQPTAIVGDRHAATPAPGQAQRADRQTTPRGNDEQSSEKARGDSGRELDQVAGDGLLGGRDGGGLPAVGQADPCGEE